MIGVSEVLAFFIGAFVGRYFEYIIKFINHLREDLTKLSENVEKETQKGEATHGK